MSVDTPAVAKQEPSLRLLRVLRIVVGGMFVPVLGFCALLALLPIVIFTYNHLPFTSVRHGDIFVCFATLVAAVYIAFAFGEWWYARRDLSEVEHRLVLAVMVLVSSFIGGTMNFAVYSTNHDSFSVSEAGARWTTQSNAEIASEADSLADNEAWIRTVLVRLNALDRAHFGFRNGAFSQWLTDTYSLNVPIPGVEIDYLRCPPSDEIPFESWSVRVREGRHEVLVNTFQQEGAGRFLGARARGVFRGGHSKRFWSFGRTTSVASRTRPAGARAGLPSRPRSSTNPQ